MDDNSGDDDTGEVRWSWRRDEYEEADQDVADEVSEKCNTPQYTYAALLSGGGILVRKKRIANEKNDELC